MRKCWKSLLRLSPLSGWSGHVLISSTASPISTDALWVKACRSAPRYPDGLLRTDCNKAHQHVDTQGQGSCLEKIMCANVRLKGVVCVCWSNPLSSVIKLSCYWTRSCGGEKDLLSRLRFSGAPAPHPRTPAQPSRRGLGRFARRSLCDTAPPRKKLAGEAAPIISASAWWAITSPTQYCFALSDSES